MKIKMLAIDLDGTLLDSNDEISEENKNALLFLRKKGVCIVLTTGRPLLEAENYIKQIDAYPYFIGINGCQTIDLLSGTHILKDNFDEKVIQEVLDILERYPVFFQLYSMDNVYAFIEKKPYLHQSGLSKHYLEKNEKNICYLDSTDIKYGEICKIFIPIETSEISQKVCRELKKIEQVTVLNSLNNFLEVIPKGCDKVKGIRKICEITSINPKEVLAIGDSENDVEMLHYCGVGIAMGNAKTIVKQVADEVTKDNDHSGVAHILRKYFENMNI